ncbi:MAG: type II secretion system F family protein [Parachlamydiaceae bacterium]|nr:type II secretion system F family protein [Parachlamydiaceae bacterium]
MALYQYQALDGFGKKRTGFIEATDEAEAKGKLREQGLMVSSMTAKAEVAPKQNLTGDVLQTFTVQLAQLVNAGVPLYQSLSAIEEQYRGEPYHRIILSLCDQLKAGKSLSEALSGYPKSFDRLYCSMITAGESAGALNIVLEKLSILLTKQNKLRTQITTALIYPGALAGFSLLIIGVLIGFVLPSIEGIFAGRELNGFTSAVLSFSHFVKDYWWLYLPIIISLLFFTIRYLKSAVGKIWLQRILIKLPVAKTVVIQSAVARFCRTMGTLQIGGLTMIESLRLAREVVGNVVIEEEIQNAENRIVEGSSLSAELMHSKVIPKMVSRMLSVGEDAGTTVVMLNKIADVYEDDIEKTLERLMALVQPVILIFLGSFIAIVLLAILLPMTDMSSFSA